MAEPATYPSQDYLPTSCFSASCSLRFTLARSILPLSHFLHTSSLYFAALQETGPLNCVVTIGPNCNVEVQRQDGEVRWTGMMSVVWEQVHLWWSSLWYAVRKSATHRAQSHVCAGQAFLDSCAENICQVNQKRIRHLGNPQLHSPMKAAINQTFSDRCGKCFWQDCQGFTYSLRPLPRPFPLQ